MEESFPRPVYRWENQCHTQKALRVSIIVPTYNRKDTLQLVLQSLNDQTTSVPFEVIIVDDGSLDGTTRMIKNFPADYPLVLYRVHRSRRTPPRNPGPLRNLGILKSRSPLVIFLDSDMVCSPGFVQTHLDAHAVDKLVVTGVFINTLNHRYPIEERRKILDFSRAFLATGNASVERKWLLEAGLFDMEFNQYGWEDLELGARLRQLGLGGKQERRAVTYHLTTELTLEHLPGRIEKEKARARMAVLYYEKHPNLRTALATMNMPLCFALARVLFLGNWPSRVTTYKLIKWTQSKGMLGIRNMLCEIVAVYSYLKELWAITRRPKTC